MLSIRRVNSGALVSAMISNGRTAAARQHVGLVAASDVECTPTTESAHVAVVDNDERAREAIALQVTTAGFKVASYASAHELLASENAKNFDCVVAEIFLPRMNGLQLQGQLMETRNFVSIVFITERDDLSLVVHAMRAGAVDVLGKPVDDEALLNAIERGVRRTRAQRMEHIQRAGLEERFRSLPPRQREVFGLITAGLLNKQVAAELGISERTVKVHRERLRRKMGADSLAELARMAGLLQTPGRMPFNRKN